MEGSDELGEFFAEIEQIEQVVEDKHDQHEEGKQTEEEVGPQITAPVMVSEVVLSKPAEIRSHTVVQYEYSHLNDAQFDPTYNPSSLDVGLAAFAPAVPSNVPVKLRTNHEFVRKAADDVWVDDTLKDWPEGDFRVFVGDLGKEVTTEMLSKFFSHYKSYAKAKVIRTKHENKARGYGFVSFLDPMDCAKAIREMNGKYLGGRSVI